MSNKIINRFENKNSLLNIKISIFCFKKYVNLFIIDVSSKHSVEDVILITFN